MPITEQCHLIAVLGGKGGVGKSVFAANLAFTLLREMKSRVLLIDMDAKSCGDQNFITGLRPQKTVSDLTSFSGALTAQSLAQFTVEHPSGLSYLAAVAAPDQILNANADVFKKQLLPISQNYKFIVADLGNDLGPLQFAAIEDASVILIVSTPEILVVNQTRRAINDLVAATVPADLIQVVINKASKSSLDPRAVAQTLQRPVVGAIPQDDVTAYGALQRSSPMVLIAPSSPIANSYSEIVRNLTGGILQKLKTLSRPKMQPLSIPQNLQIPGNVANAGARQKPAARQLSHRTLLKLQVHSELIREMDLKKDLMKTEGDPQKEKDLRNKTQKVISQLVDKLAQGMARDERLQIIKEVLDESLGLGPLEDLLSDPNVTEIMVNGSDHIYVEKSGKLQLSTITFTSNLQLRNVIERIVSPLGRRIDEKTPYVDARLADGSRVNAIIEPLSIDGPALTIRKFPKERITSDDYVKRFGSMTQAMVDFLRVCVEQGLNIIISGGTGSGKTTLLNVLSGFIPVNERIITVEDAAELQLKQEHVVRLETRPANIEGSGEVAIRDLIKNSLRMRPDRIVVGECRDGAALDMLAAMNTGHDGSMTTVHSNNPREAVSRLETLCLMAGMDLPARAIREQIAGAVDLIVQISRMSDGSRKITNITEVVGMQGETVTLQEIFRFKEEGFDKNRKIIGQFQASGLIPTFIEQFEQRGVSVPRDLFTTSSSANAPASGPSNVLKPRAPLGVKPPTALPNTPIKKVGGSGGS